jgi:hypothetical protein
MRRLRSVISDAANMDEELLAYQLEVSGVQVRPGCSNSDAMGAVEEGWMNSYLFLFVGTVVGTDGVVQGFVMSDSYAEKDTEQYSSRKREFGMATAQSTTWLGIVSHFEVVLESEEVEEVGLDNLLGRSLVKQKVHQAVVSHNPVKGIWQVRRARVDHSLESPAEEEHVWE